MHTDRTASPPRPARRRWMLGTGGSLAVSGLASLAGCGFHLRRSTSLPFRTLYTNLSPTAASAWPCAARCRTPKVPSWSPTPRRPRSG